MPKSSGSFVPHRVRTLFISDYHFGSRYCQSEALADALRSIEMEKIYLVGDFVDGWLHSGDLPSLLKNNAVFRELLRHRKNGTQIKYLAGNHDRHLHEAIAESQRFDWCETDIHVCSDHRKLYVIHGDQFDSTQLRFARLARMAAYFHEGLLGSSALLNRCFKAIGVRSVGVGTMLTTPVKKWMKAYSSYDHALSVAVAANHCDGIISGHTHSPMLCMKEGLIYANTGDWLEHCSFLLESESGQLELWGGSAEQWHNQVPIRRGLITAQIKKKPQLESGDCRRPELIGS